MAVASREAMFSLAGLACQVVYRAGGFGDGALVRALLPTVGTTVAPMAPGVGSGRDMARQRRFRVSLPATLPGEVITLAGTGPAGSVAALRTGDTIEVEGWRAGRPDQASVVLTFGKDISRFGPSHWTGEVAS